MNLRVRPRVNGDCDNCLQLKKCWSCNSPKSRHSKWSFEAEFLVSLFSFCDEKKTVTPPLLLFFFFTRYGYKKNFFKDKKICTVGVVLFRYKRRETSQLEPQRSMRMIKLSIFLTFLQDQVIWSHFTENYSPVKRCTIARALIYKTGCKCWQYYHRAEPGLKSGFIKSGLGKGHGFSTLRAAGSFFTNAKSYAGKKTSARSVRLLCFEILSVNVLLT